MSLQITTNHPETLQYVEATGKLIQNFGVIELYTYDWISVLQTDSMVFEMARRSKLRDRIEVIKKMIQRSPLLSDESKERLVALWSSIIPHSEVRNIVSHSGVVMGFLNNDPAQPITVKGVLNLKPRDKSRESEFISVEEINGSVNATSRIASSLLESFKQLKSGSAYTSL